MSDKDDVVLEALERLSKYLTSFCDDVLEYKCDLSLLRLAEKAIAIQKAQARVIGAARAYTTVTNKNDFPNRWDGLCSAIKNLDEKVTT